MARRRGVGGSTSGGDGIQTARETRARVTQGAVALAIAAGLAAVPPLEAERDAWVSGALGIAAVLVLAIGLAWRMPVITVGSLALLGTAYVVRLLLDDAPVDSRAPLYAAGFLAVGELALFSLERRAARPEPGVALRRALLVVALAFASVGLGALVLAAASVPVGGGIALEALGVAAVLAVLALVARLVLART